MWDIDKSITKALKNQSFSKLTPKTNLALGRKRPASFSMKSKINYLTTLARGGVFFPLTQPTVRNPVSGRVIKGHIPTVQRVMKNFFGDKDKDGVKNLFDCQPKNPKKQDTYIYLSKKKDKDKETMYTYSHPSKKVVKRIFIGGKYKKFDFDRPGQIGGVARVIGHEELHGVLDREGLSEASEKLDVIAKPTEMATNPQTGEGVFLFPEKEKEIVGVKGRQDVLNVYDNLVDKGDKK